MSANSSARLLHDSDGSVEYKGRIYKYSYDSGTELQLSIMAPEANSRIANEPSEALEMFWLSGTGASFPSPVWLEQSGRLPEWHEIPED